VLYYGKVLDAKAAFPATELVSQQPPGNQGSFGISGRFDGSATNGLVTAAVSSPSVANVPQKNQPKVRIATEAEDLLINYNNGMNRIDNVDDKSPGIMKDQRWLDENVELIISTPKSLSENAIKRGMKSAASEESDDEALAEIGGFFDALRLHQNNLQT
uniref:Uncharacterized protein n=1 Tax=Romanomermis culicivorax TaxID=13658 RepID=A0A915ICF1_ROMCU